MLRCAALAASFALLSAAAGAQAALPLAQAHYAVSTQDAAAQAAFDRGLAFLYAFGVAEARLSFERAAALDPNLAMAYWGEALADTIDINLPDTAEGDRRAAVAVAAARAHLGGATPAERALIEAIALRYTGKGSPDDRMRRYAGAMTEYAVAHPGDADGLTVAAYAQWNADGDTLLGKDGTPSAAAQRMLGELDAALQLDPANIGAHHLRIHLSEDIGRAEAALSDARFFDGLGYAPGMSHLPHMAGHIYARVGDYDALVAANRRAVANDAAYFALGNGEGQQYIRRYHDHDLSFIAYGLTTQGRNAEALAALADEDQIMNLQLALRLHDDARALELATAAGNLPGQAYALARLGRAGPAAAAFAKLGQSTRYARLQRTVAAAMIARAAGDPATAIAQYRAALALLGRHPGDPKTLWYVPPGEALGAVELEAKRYADAEATFAAELVRFPNDPRLAFGLAEAQRAQGKDDAAARAIVEREWKGDHVLTRGDLG